MTTYCLLVSKKSNLVPLSWSDRRRSDRQMLEGIEGAYRGRRTTSETHTKRYTSRPMTLIFCYRLINPTIANTKRKISNLCRRFHNEQLLRSKKLYDVYHPYVRYTILDRIQSKTPSTDSPKFVTLPKRENHIRVRHHHFNSSFIHQVKCAFIVWFLESMDIRESVPKSICRGRIHSILAPPATKAIGKGEEERRKEMK